MPAPLKYAVVERERRYLVVRLPPGVTSTKDITDRYITGTRLRLREMRDQDGTGSEIARERHPGVDT